MWKHQHIWAVKAVGSRLNESVISSYKLSHSFFRCLFCVPLLDPLPAGCHAGQWPGGGVREQPMGSLLTGQKGRPTWQPHEKGDSYLRQMKSGREELIFLIHTLPQAGHSHNTSHQSHNTMIVTSSSSSSATTPHRVVGQQGYDGGMMNKGGQYQPGMTLSISQSGGTGPYPGNMSQGTDVDWGVNYWNHIGALHVVVLFIHLQASLDKNYYIDVFIVTCFNTKVS